MIQGAKSSLGGKHQIFARRHGYHRHPGPRRIFLIQTSPQSMDVFAIQLKKFRACRSHRRTSAVGPEIFMRKHFLLYSTHNIIRDQNCDEQLVMSDVSLK